MTTRVIHDHGVRHTFTGELIGREGCTLVARARLVDPHMHVEPSAMGLVDRRQGCPPIHGGQPAGIAVGEHLKRLVLTRWGTGRRQLLKQRKTVITNGRAHRHILIRNQAGFLLRG